MKDQQDREQSAFEDWLSKTCPSGDVTEVQRQWEASSEYADWKAQAGAESYPPMPEIVLTFNWGALVKVEAAGVVLYEVDLSPQPYWQVCWASGWGGEYDTQEQAQQECESMLGYGRATREVRPGDEGYRNPRTLSLKEKRFPVDATAALRARGAVPSDAEILALNAGEVHFSESPSKYPEYGFGTQYHGGAPGVVSFARAVLARWAAAPQPPAALPGDEP